MKKLYRIVMLTCMILAIAIMPVMAESVTSGSLTTSKITKGFTYDFGSYPQTEIVAEAKQSGAYGRVWETDGDYKVDKELYSKLQSANWNSDDTTINDIKYHRIERSDATYYNSGSSYYNWADSTTYRYFRYDPIKWRVLQVDDEDAFLLADIALDDQKYNTDWTDVTWEASSIRNWLNSTFYNRAFSTEEQEAIKTTSVENKDNLNYTTIGGNNTEDKVFLLSESEVYDEGGATNGFESSYSTYDKARMSKSSSYAKAMGASSNTESSNLGNCCWWLRSPGHRTRDAAYVSDSGSVIRDGNYVNSNNYAIRPALHINTKSSNLPVRIIRTMKLSQEKFDYDGTAKKPTVTIEGLAEDEDYVVKYKNNTEIGTATVYAVGIGKWSGALSRIYKIGHDISNKTVVLSETSYTYDGVAKEPRVSIEGITEGNDFKVEYSRNVNAGTARIYVTGINECYGELTAKFTIKKASVDSYYGVSFGSYPQTEIVGEASQSGVYGKPWVTEGDYEVDDVLYSKLQSASWDAGDTTIDGIKYHRIKEGDATYTSTPHYESSPSYYYNWSDSTTYHYFRYDPIKWRVLKAGDEDAFLLADVALDCQKYKDYYKAVTWENCSVRNWLNSTFYNRAFSTEEQEVIKTTSVENKDNLNSGTAGGNDTEDKVFLLSESEVYGEGGAANGFASSYGTGCNARMSKSSSYAKAMGVWSNPDSAYLGNCFWWLRSPGKDTKSVADVRPSGDVIVKGQGVTCDHAIRPALHIKLESSDLIRKYDAEVDMFANLELSSSEYEYDGTAKGPTVSIEGFVEGRDFNVSYTDNVKAGTAEAVITAIGNYKGQCTRRFTINKADIQKFDATLSQDEFVYDGNLKEPRVTIKNLTEGEEYAVSYENNTEIGMAKAIITGKGSCYGTKEVTFKICKASDDITAELEKETYEFENTEIKPAVIVKDGDDTLTEGEDYELECKNNKMPGWITVKVLIGGKYVKAERSLVFEIECTDQVVVEAKEATCTEAGYKSYRKCKKHNVALEPVTTIPATGHKYGDWKVTKKASCTENGIEERRCENCNDAETRDIPATGHNMEHKKTAPKVGIKGSEWDECTVCGTKENVKSIAALNPAATTIISIKAAPKSFTAKWTKRSYTGYQLRYSLKSSMVFSKTVTVTKSSTTSKKISKLKAKKKYYVQVRTYKTVNGKKYYSAWSAKKAVTTK